MTEADKIIAACDAIGLTMQADRRTSGKPVAHNMWTVYLKRADGRKMRVNYGGGEAVTEATIPDVVSSLVLDTQWLEANEPCDDRAALERHCEKARAFFGDDFDAIAEACADY